MGVLMNNQIDQVADYKSEPKLVSLLNNLSIQLDRQEFLSKEIRTKLMLISSFDARGNGETGVQKSNGDEKKFLLLFDEKMKQINRITQELEWACEHINTLV